MKVYDHKFNKVVTQVAVVTDFFLLEQINTSLGTSDAVIHLITVFVVTVI
jgi:hypothetical protein